MQTTSLRTHVPFQRPNVAYYTKAARDSLRTKSKKRKREKERRRRRDRSEEEHLEQGNDEGDSKFRRNDNVHPKCNAPPCTKVVNDYR